MVNIDSGILFEKIKNSLITQQIIINDIDSSQNAGNMSRAMALCHLQEHLEINMVKKLMDTATKTGIDAAKTASKRVVQKTAEAAGDLTGNKIADKITSVGKSKNKEKKMKQMR